MTRPGRRLGQLLLIVCIGLAGLLPPVARAEQTLTIGVFAYRPKAEVQARWQPLMDYLAKALPDKRVRMRLLEHEEMEAAMQRRQLDFVFTNPAQFIALRQHTGLSGALATLVEQEQGQLTALLGGVIFTRAGEAGLERLTDLRGKTAAYPGTKGLAAYPAQAYELSLVGLRVPGEVKALVTGWPQDRVVEAVLAGKADVGFIRSGVLEQMARSGKLDISRLRILNPQTYPGFPFAVSTRLYPEWPFVALPHVDERTARRVAAALLSLDPDGPVARSARFGGFTIPANYQPVEEVMRALRLPPYDRTPPFSFRDVWARYHLWLSAFAGAFLVILGLVVWTTLINRRLKEAQRRLEQQSTALRESEAQFRTLVQNMPGVVYRCDLDAHWTVRFVSDHIRELTGYPPGDFIANRVRSYASLIHPEDVEHVDRMVREGVARDAPFTLEYRILHADGTVRWVFERGRAELDAKGEAAWLDGVFMDISARKAAEEQVRQLAYFDPLTGLPNRRMLMDRLGHALVSSARSQEYGALLMLDLDHFKTLNDTRGHDVGDQMLKEVAHRLLTTIRQEDTVSRLGGDEFVLMLEGLGTEEQLAASQAEFVAEKVRQTLQKPYALHGGADFQTSCSIGVALYHRHDIPAEILLKQADVALYQAKDAGRNAIRFFNPAMQAAIDARLAMDSALRRGLQQGELRLYYQPQVDMQGALLGAEALLRWLPPGQPAVPPAQFIPLAESTGFIEPLGLWVLEHACMQLKDWEGDGRTRHLSLSLNVSARQFRQEDFVARVAAVLQKTGANPARLKLELTESALLEDMETAIVRMARIRALGVAFSLDDFGTGFSSLSYLKQLPLDQIKVDQSFVRDIAEDPNDAAIVRAILAMSRSLGLDVIAEGVETEEQHAFLRENGCTAFQGYLFGRPMPIEEWTGLLPPP